MYYDEIKKKKEKEILEEIKKTKRNIRNLKIEKIASFTTGIMGYILLEYYLEPIIENEDNTILQELLNISPTIFLGIFATIGALLNVTKNDLENYLERIYNNNPQLIKYDNSKKLIKK